MSEIQTLTTQAEQLSRSVDRWNTGVIWALVFAALAAFAVVVTTRVAFVRAKELAGVQAAIIRAKDAELVRDSKEKDVKIEEAKERASRAEERAAEANRAAAEANRAAEQERLARVKIEERLADRKLSDTQIKTIAGQLSPFAGQEYEIVTVRFEREPRHLAEQISEALNRAGWRYIKPTSPQFVMDVVGIILWIHPAASDNTKMAATSFIAALAKERLSVDVGNLADPSPRDIIGINIGTRP